MKDETYETIVDESWKDRLKKEYIETKERLEKLKKHLLKNELKKRYERSYVDFPHSSSEMLMQEQSEVMSQYLHILELRMMAENIDF